MTEPHNTKTLGAAPQLLHENEPEPFLRELPHDHSSVLLVCDHASAVVPASLNNLGLSTESLTRHIAWDRGALHLSRMMSRHLTCGLIAARYSRLVIDVNRDIEHADSIIELSEDTPIPHNIDLSADEAARRHNDIFEPYHRALGDTVNVVSERHGRCDLVAVHSFTPQYLGRQRPWEFGILWNEDDRLAVPLIDRLRKLGFTVGDNEPYSGRDPAGYTIRTHGEDNGHPHVLIEVRDDLIETPDGQNRVAHVLSEQLTVILSSL